MYVWPSPLALSWRPSAYVMYVYKSSARNWLPHVCIVTMDPSVTRCNCGYWEVKTGDLSTLGEHICLLILLTCFHFLLSDNACIVPSSHSKLRDPSVWGSQEERTGEVLDANSGAIGSQVSTSWTYRCVPSVSQCGSSSACGPMYQQGGPSLFASFDFMQPCYVAFPEQRWERWSWPCSKVTDLTTFFNRCVGLLPGVAPSYVVKRHMQCLDCAVCGL